MNLAPHLFEEFKIVPKGVGQVAQIGFDLKVSRVIDIAISQEIVPTWDRILLLKGEAYELELCEIKMPKDKWGYIIGRSTFNRQGVLIRSSVIDPGYNGMIGVTAYVLGRDVCKISLGERVGQLLVFKAAVSSVYDGQYQYEGANKTDKK